MSLGMNKNTENGNDIFISEFFDLENELNLNYS